MTLQNALERAIDRARYYDDIPTTKEAFLAFLEDLREDWEAVENEIDNLCTAIEVKAPRVELRRGAEDLRAVLRG